MPFFTRSILSRSALLSVEERTLTSAVFMNNEARDKALHMVSRVRAAVQQETTGIHELVIEIAAFFV